MPVTLGKKIKELTRCTLENKEGEKSCLRIIRWAYMCKAETHKGFETCNTRSQCANIHFCQVPYLVYLEKPFQLKQCLCFVHEQDLTLCDVYLSFFRNRNARMDLYNMAQRLDERQD